MARKSVAIHKKRSEAFPPLWAFSVCRSASGEATAMTKIMDSAPTRANDSSSANGYPDANTGALWQGELSAEHRQTLEVESAISPDVIKARGYFTCNDPALLRLHGFSKGQALPGALVVPLWDADGQRAGVAIRHTIARTDRNAKKVKYDLPNGAAPTLDLSPATRDLLADNSKPLIFTEGAKKADSAAAQGFPAINLNGVWGFASKGVLLPDWEKLRPYLHSRTVLVAYDSDAAKKWGVGLAMRRLEGLLKSMGAKVKVIYFEDAPNGDKIGLDDFFASGGTVEKLWELARDLEPVEESNRKRKEKEKADKRAKIEEKAGKMGAVVIETNDRQQQDELTDLAHAIEKFNSAAPRLFHGAAGLVRIELTSEGTPTLRHATREAISSIAGKAARWISTNESDVREVAPPRDLCAIFLASSDDWRGIPIIEGTATAPFFAPDGTLCATPGYHEAARTWLSLASGFDVGDTEPTPENVRAARQMILSDILGEVSFGDDASRAHAVAQMILPFVRRLIQGSTPLHLWNAPLRGSGKSYAAELCILPFAEPTPTPEKANAEEWRKSLLCDLITGPSHIFFDNIKGSLHSPALDAAITSSHFKDRLTGTGEMVTAPVRCVWVATANNAELTEDAVTRAVVIAVDPESETPDTRRFRHNPKAFIRANRGRVCGAIITLVRAWQAAGAPDYSDVHRCRFPQWANVIGGILEVVEIRGFLENLEEARENIGTDEQSRWRDLVTDWHEEFGGRSVTVFDLLKIANKIEDFGEILSGDTSSIMQQQLAKAIREKRNRRFGKWKIQAAPKIRRKVAYRLISVENPENGAENAENGAKQPQNVQGLHSQQGSTSKARNSPFFVESQKINTDLLEKEGAFAPYTQIPCEPCGLCTSDGTPEISSDEESEEF